LEGCLFSPHLHTPLETLANFVIVYQKVRKFGYQFCKFHSRCAHINQIYVKFCLGKIFVRAKENFWEVPPSRIRFYLNKIVSSLMILTVKHNVGDFIVFKLLNVC